MADILSTTQQFEKLYKALNSAQRKAVDAIEGPVMVIAGPGTGKTQILALRIANILRKTDTPPDAILALAFTESAVHSMRQRLVHSIGAPAYKIPIFTFHGLANDIISRFPEAFPRIIGSTPVADIDQIDIFRDIIENSADPLLRPYGDPLYYLEPIRSYIKQLKRENIGPADLKKRLSDQEKSLKKIPEGERLHQKGAYKGKVKSEFIELVQRLEKNSALAEIYAAYEKALAKRRLYDFEDMIRDVVATLQKDSDLLLRLQEQYQYILADEHQDANAAQNAFLELLASFHENPNLFIVGDEKQAIFRFQGASLDNFLYFKKRFPTATVISLKENYRSSQAILDAAFGLIENNKVNDPTLHIPLKAGKSEVGISKIAPITLHEAVTPRHELDFIVGDITQRLTENPAADIAVIFRTNSDAPEISRALQLAGIPFTLHSSRDLFAEPNIANLILLARTVAQYGDTVLLGRFLYVDFLALDPLDVFKLTRYTATNKLLLADVLVSKKDLEAAGVAEPAAFLAVAQKLSDLARFAKNHYLVDTFDYLLQESGFLPHVLKQPNSPHILAALETLLAEVKKITRNTQNRTGARLEHFIRFVDAAIEHAIPIEIIVPEAFTGVEAASRGVQLMTAHKSKGLEFETVYIVGAQEGHWGGRRDRTHFHIPIQMENGPSDPVADERRLFYVALTRAKKEIIITWSATDDAGKAKLPSQFVSELQPQFVRKTAPLPVSKTPFVSVSSSSAGPIPIANLDYIRGLFRDQGWSVTALNNYLTCPWQYFFRNLIRLPEAQSKHQLYGIAIHDTLSHFFRRADEGVPMKKTEFLDLFVKLLQRQPLTMLEAKTSIEKGEKALRGWYDWQTKRGENQNGFVEYSIAGVGLSAKDLFIPLRGTLDRLVFLTEKEVGVIDFKTAAPKTRNEMLGKTKNATGDYFRQLVFYKLLLDLHENGKWHMAWGDIEFIEPDVRANYHRERFEIPETEIKTLKETIVAATNDIWSGSFWNRTCDNGECVYCKLRKILPSPHPRQKK